MIVLYNPPSNPSRKAVMPQSLLAIGAMLEGKYEYSIVDGNLQDDPIRTLNQVIVEADNPLLGVTVMPGPQLQHAVPHCKELKSRHPDLPIVWGGYFPTQHYEICLRADYVDYVVRGHGEHIFKNLLDAHFSGSPPLNEIGGIAYRDPSSGAITTTGRASIPDPDQLPGFPYHRIPMERYVRSTFMGRRTLSHHSSYGCPFTCNFCAVVNMVDGAWLPQSAKRTADTTEHLVNRWNADSVEFYDNNFFVYEARTAEFAERIQPLNIRWWGESRIDTLLSYDEASWNLMKESGLRMVFLGAESGSDQTLERMNKGGKASTEKTLELATKMHRYDIVPEFSFILGNPPNPEEDTYQTLEFIRTIKDVNPDSEIILYMYTPVPLSGTLFDEARKNGFDFPDTLEEWIQPEWKSFVQRRSANLPWVRNTLRSHVRDFERVLNAYYPTVTDASLSDFWRRALRLLSSWRYNFKIYAYPLELMVLQKLIAYQRPETSGF